VLWYDGDPDEKELTRALKTKLPRYMLPNRIYKVDKLPFTANGKIDRMALRKMYEKG
jgi:acyl-CoA synthetase (AMP-forming)/AMP-acid ligase II